MSHTPEPWHVYGDECAIIGAAENPEFCITTRDTGRNLTEKECQANARRIVACVNACAGITTEFLESVSPHTVKTLIGFGAELGRCEYQMDELIAALKYHQEQTRPIQQTIDVIAKYESADKVNKK